MVSGLYGHSLSEVKDYWKRTSNGQSSFARNPEATSSWLALMSDHPDSGRLKPIVDFLPELLVTKRLDRPLAQTVVDRLSKLCLLFPDPPHLVNTCCGPPPVWIEGLPPERIRGSGLPKTRDQQFWSDLYSNFDAVKDREMTYIILDQYFEQVATKHDCYSSIWDVLRDSDIPSIKATCDMLFLQSDKTKPLLDHLNSQAVASTTLDLDHVLPQVLETYTAWQAIFTALRVQIFTPETQWASTDVQRFQLNGLLTVQRTRTVQISMVGHGRCAGDNHFFSSVFYVLAFKVYSEGYEPSKLGAPFVDLSVTTPS